MSLIWPQEKLSIWVTRKRRKNLIRQSLRKPILIVFHFYNFATIEKVEERNEEKEMKDKIVDIMEIEDNKVYKISKKELESKI